LQAQHIIPVNGAFLDADGQSASSLHGVSCIDRQIEKRHLDLVGIGLGRLKVVVDVEQHLDTRPTGAYDQIAHLIDKRAHVDGRGL
tara:strand:- start:3024 stop:3281 length:258 start_codon:yes stop_codon:yes gene_type:complete